MPDGGVARSRGGVTPKEAVGLGGWMTNRRCASIDDEYTMRVQYIVLDGVLQLYHTVDTVNALQYRI